MSVRSLDFDQDAEKLFSELENDAGSHLEEAINYSVRTLRDDEAYFDPYHAIRLYEGMDSHPLDEIVSHDIRDEKGLVEYLKNGGEYQDIDKVKEFRDEKESIQNMITDTGIKFSSYAATHDTDDNIIDPDSSNQESSKDSLHDLDRTDLGWNKMARVMLTSYEQALHCSDPSVEKEPPFEDDNLNLLDFYDQIGFQEFDGKYLPLKPTAVGAELLNGFMQDYQERHPHIFDN